MIRTTAASALILNMIVLTVPQASGQDAGTSAKQEFMIAHKKMSKEMMIDYTGDVDADFVRGMIPHHQGAVDMCRIEIKYGKDEEIIRLCRNIISAQEEEISFMKEWLIRKGKK